MRPSKLAIAAIAVALALPMASSANAALWDFEGTFNGHALSATITESAGQVTDMSGTFAGYGNITGVFSNPNFPGTYVFANTHGDHLIADNIWNPTAPYLNDNGVDFETSSGMVFNLWGNAPGNYTLWSGWNGSFNNVAYIPPTTINNATITAIPVPEPESYAMMLAGLGLMGWVGRRRKQQAA